MKTFWAVFFAILAAALVIGAIIGIGKAHDDLVASRARTDMVRRQTAALKETTKFYNDQIEASMQRAIAPAPTP